MHGGMAFGCTKKSLSYVSGASPDAHLAAAAGGRIGVPACVDCIGHGQHGDTVGRHQRQQRLAARPCATVPKQARLPGRTSAAAAATARRDKHAGACAAEGRAAEQEADRQLLALVGEVHLCQLGQQLRRNNGARLRGAACARLGTGVGAVCCQPWEQCPQQPRRALWREHQPVQRRQALLS
eukprot:364268-Chlamydomonas_euryale.AAC.24